MPSTATAMKENPAQLEFEAGAFGVEAFHVAELEVDEGLSSLFSIRAVVLSNEEIKSTDLVGKEGQAWLRLGTQVERYFHGMVSEVTRTALDKGHFKQRYRFHLQPSLSKLQHIRQSRIFQELSVPDILKKVFDGQSIQHEMKLSGSYQPREYCVQYRESDFDFASRLMEEEGIFYFFRFEQGQHVLTLLDATSSCQPISGSPALLYRPPAGMVAEDEHIQSLNVTERMRPEKVTLRDFDFVHPSTDLTSDAKGEETHGLEVYEYPGKYTALDLGKQRAQVRLEELRTDARVNEGISTCRRFVPGATFEAQEHPLAELNGQYVLTSVHHRAAESHGSETTSGRGNYRNSFHCIAAASPFRPKRNTAKPILAGPQTALVVGPQGEEIHTDAHGRIKAQFHWDREGKRNEFSSCWLRVSQSWAGEGWGALFLPRIGQEVVVDFLEGDPDQPLVVGSVYNGEQPTPVALPDDKTQSTLRSSSSPGNNGFNEFRFEDAAGAEEVYLHAQKNLRVAVENDKSQTVGGNETLSVGADRSRSVTGNQSLSVQGNDSSSVLGNQTLSVVQNRSTSVAGNHTETVGGSQSISVGATHSLTVGLASAENVGAAKVVSVGAALSVNVGAAMNELVGGMKAEEIGGAKVEVVGAKKSETVAGARSVNVGKDLSETIGGERSVKVAKDASLTVGGSLSHTVKSKYSLNAKEIAFTAEEDLTLTVGSSVIQIKKNGDILIKSGKIKVTAKGNMILKASKITEN